MDDQTFVPALCYRDPKAAIAWLEAAFGFEVTMAIDGPGGDPTQSHYEMACGGKGRVMVGGEWNDSTRSPASAEGRTSATVHVTLPGDVDEHCAKARAAGARIVMEPADQFYGDRSYGCTDPEGHQWTFSAHVRDVSRADAEAAIGLPIHAPAWP